MPTPINAVYDLGGTGPTTLYSHATGFHAMCWQPIANRLSNHHNIAYDARGHGNTPVDPEWIVDWQTHGADAAAIAATLQNNGPVLGVGHSMGGAAMLMAALAQPQLFRGLIVYEPIVMPPEVSIPGNGGAADQSGGNFLAAGARKRRSTFESFDAAIANYSAKPPINVFDPESLEAYVRAGFAEGPDGHVHLKCAPESEARNYEAGGNHKTWARLGELRIPVWVVCGLPQPMQPSSRMRALAEQIPSARYIELDNLGHFGPMQAPAQIAEIIASFPA